MRKLILQFFMAVILLSLVSCGEGSKTANFYNTEYTEENVDEIALPHPFATALKEFMADYDGVARAYLATLDDDGTIGVLVRPSTKRRVFDYGYEEYVYVYEHSGTMFYIQDDELFQIDARGLSWRGDTTDYCHAFKRIPI